MKIKRPYIYTDGKALTIAARLCGLYAEHLSDFEAHDPDLGTAYHDAWKAAIDLAMNMPTDETTVDDQQISAAITAEKMTLCAAAVRDLRYYAALAFDGDEEQNVFGFERLSKLRHAPTAYAVAVRSMHLLAQDYAIELGDQGMTPAHMQALLDTANVLIDAEVQHEFKKRIRVRTTIQRKRAFVRVWSFVQRIQLAANVLYAEDEVMRGLFVSGE
jgi:hypothetical protein